MNLDRRHLQTRAARATGAIETPSTHVQHMRRSLLALLASLVAAGASSAQAESEQFPNRVVKIIVPSSPGGGMDTIGRLIASKLQGYWNVPVVIENRPGASMAIGAQLVARSQPDGYTLLVAHEGTIVINTLLGEQTPYSIKDFEPVLQVWETPLILLVNSNLPVRNLSELDTLLKKNGGRFNFGVADIHSELMAQMIQQEMGWNYVTVTYKGNPERLQSLLADETQLTFMGAGDAAMAISSGRARAIGISSAARSKRLPAIPTLEESGMRGFRLTTWGGIFAPAGTPVVILTKIRGDLRRALSEQDVIDRIESGGNQIVAAGGDEFRQKIAQSVARWQKVAMSRGMKTYSRQ